MKTLLFVYGTLKRGGGNHRQMEGQTFLAPARTVPGFRLYDLGGFPGLFADPADTEGVVGEVWSVDEDALERLDAFEGVAEGLYRRAALPLQTPFAATRVEAYLPPGHAPAGAIIGNEWRE